MKKHKFIIKFNKSVILERKDNNKLILKSAVFKDSFLNNFNDYSNYGLEFTDHEKPGH
ncbi:MAG: hypothetical protein AB8W37_01045 [Arsenophonus endosymbiont of Dermacentor nuttalli]